MSILTTNSHKYHTCLLLLCTNITTMHVDLRWMFSNNDDWSDGYATPRLFVLLGQPIEYLFARPNIYGQRPHFQRSKPRVNADHSNKRITYSILTLFCIAIWLVPRARTIKCYSSLVIYLAEAARWISTAIHLQFGEWLLNIFSMSSRFSIYQERHYRLSTQ